MPKCVHALKLREQAKHRLIENLRFEALLEPDRSAVQRNLDQCEKVLGRADSDNVSRRPWWWLQ